LTVDETNAIIKTEYNSNAVGLNLDYVQNFYALGDYDNVNGGSAFLINSGTGNNAWITTDSNGNEKGLKLTDSNNQYLIGSGFGAGDEYFGIDTSANTLIAGANLTSGTAGGSSGQHLKIKLNGVDYKIALLNP